MLFADVVKVGERIVSTLVGCFGCLDAEASNAWRADGLDAYQRGGVSEPDSEVEKEKGEVCTRCTREAIRGRFMSSFRGVCAAAINKRKQYTNLLTVVSKACEKREGMTRAVSVSDPALSVTSKRSTHCVCGYS